MRTPKPHPRPLLVRPGARFRCAGDGLCCTDLHALGPLSRVEAVELRRLIPRSVFRHAEIDAPCMRPGAGGGCAQLQKDGRCGVHGRFGAEAKPVGCRRFPYGLVNTPQGGRVTTEHRCPCRTLGERPALDLADAEASLLGRGGRLEADEDAPQRMPLTYRKRVAFERCAELEGGLLARLEKGERAEHVLGAKAFPELVERSWPIFATELLDMGDGTRGGVAIAWFSDALLELTSGHKPPKRTRPWQDAFERGAARAQRPDSPERVINDWVADELWMMRWFAFGCAFDVARAELVTRVTAVRGVIKRLTHQGVRADQAAAEAVMMAELAACSEVWPDAVDAIANDPSPAAALE